MSTNETYIPTESHQTLYKKISKMRDMDISYEQIGVKLLPDEQTSVSKGIIWRCHKKNKWPTDNGIRMKLSLPKLITVQQIPGTLPQAPACPTCGGACMYDCGTQRPVTIGTPRNLSRCTIYPGTDVDKIVADLYRVTGITFAPVSEELEY